MAKRKVQSTFQPQQHEGYIEGRAKTTLTGDPKIQPGCVIQFTYTKSKTDPRPLVLVTTPIYNGKLFGVNLNYLDEVIKESSKYIMKMKYHYNRPRPYQVAEFYGIDLNGTTIASMKTPSYPSGHATQGYLVAEILTSHDPRNGREYRKLGEEIAHSRIIAKAHYPSDKFFGKELAKVLYAGLK